ncbi:HXXEE domain-containing protein [Mucilaginibacter ximonensis]|uniref:HXXEE domain-containing protein n=1 Tax=Mucilaginibacter ximonensis TaxID=538021 RepID=A0ABW5Y9Q8_9SPHI
MNITFSTLAILLTAAVMLHVTEEFLVPGGFADWYARLMPPKTEKKNNTGFLVWINTLMMFVCALALYFGNTALGYTFWYYNAAIAAANALFHLWGVFKLKAYSPGVVTGLLLYVPLFVIGTKQLVGSGELPLTKAIIAIALGIGYHIFSVIRQSK